MTVYADNAATTRVSKTALDAMLPFFDSVYGNPSSLHRFGQAAARALQSARETVARCIGADPKEIRFTSCGSESDTQAILTGAAFGERTGRKKIVVSAIEHHAVLRAAEAAERNGFSLSCIPVTKDGIVCLDAAERLIDQDTALVSVMLANNETGVIQPIQALSAICREQGALMHTDAVQAVGHIPVDISSLGADLLSLSAHKFHGPKGAGALFIRRGLSAARLVMGGGQERGDRAGTENIPSIVGMAAALDESVSALDRTAPYVASLRLILTEALTGLSGCYVYGDPQHMLPGIACFGFDGISSESLLLRLDMLGVAASAGSACMAGSLEPSHVLRAMGIPSDRASLRLSLDNMNTPDDIEYIVECVAKARVRSAPI